MASSSTTGTRALFEQLGTTDVQRKAVAERLFRSLRQRERVPSAIISPKAEPAR